MNKSSFLKAAALVALAFITGAAFASPDLLHTGFHAVASHLGLNGGVMLAFGPLVRGLQEKQAATAAEMKALVDRAEAADRDLTAEEQTKFGELKASLDGFKGRIARAQEQELIEAGLSNQSATAAAANLAEQNTGRSVQAPANAFLSVSENSESDPNRGFASMGDFSRAIVGATYARRNGQAMDNRLVPLAAAPGSFAGEGNGADGGILVPPGFANSVITLSLAEDALLPLTDSLPIDGNSMLFPKDETTPWGTNGIRAYWQAEGSAGTPTKPLLSGLDLRLQKLLALVPVSNEMLGDQSALGAYLPSKIGDSIRWKTNEAILNGSGVGVPLGAFNSGATITVAKDAGQASGTLSATNLANMIARLPPGSYPNAVWLINNDVLPALFTLTLGNYPIYLPGGSPVGGLQTNPYGMLLGRPIIVTQHAKSFSSQGDVTLADLSYYQAITASEGLQMASSMHLYFDADAMAFRTTYRINGAPKITAPMAPANGSKTLSPFVQLGAR